MVQLQADSAAPLTASGDVTLGLPGRYRLTVAAGTESQALGTCRNSPRWNVVMSAPGVTSVGPGPPDSSSTTATTAAVTTTRPPAMEIKRRRLRAAARRARPPGPRA